MAAVHERDIEELFEALLKLRTRKECRMFLHDLLTEGEIVEFAERWKTARMLTAGDSYAAIARRTGLSSRTIARVAKWLSEGEGGYAMMMKRIGPGTTGGKKEPAGS